ICVRNLEGETVPGSLETTKKKAGPGISPLAGKPAPREMLLDVSRLERDYSACRPDLEDLNQWSASERVVESQSLSGRDRRQITVQRQRYARAWPTGRSPERRWILLFPPPAHGRSDRQPESPTSGPSELRGRLRDPLQNQRLP